MIKDSGERTEFTTGAVRDLHDGKGRMDLLPWRAIMEVSKLCEKGAQKYGEHNVDKGIPVHSLYDSGIRHAMKFWTRWEDEDHLTAACWNLLWALEMTLTKTEMDDRPGVAGADPEQAAPPAPKKPKKAPKKPVKQQAPKKPENAPDDPLFAGYGARLKKQTYDRLLKARENGVTLNQISDATGGMLSVETITDMCRAGKVRLELWELLARTLNQIEAGGAVND